MLYGRNKCSFHSSVLALLFKPSFKLIRETWALLCLGKYICPCHASILFFSLSWSYVTNSPFSGLLDGRGSHIQCQYEVD